MQWQQGTRGFIAHWLGAAFRIGNSGADKSVMVHIKDDLFNSAHELLKLLGESKKTPRQPTRKLSNIANYLLSWRQFLRPLHGAIYSEKEWQWKRRGLQRPENLEELIKTLGKPCWESECCDVHASEILSALVVSAVVTADVIV